MQEVTVTGSTTSIALTMGSRVNSRFRLTVSDDAPAEVRNIRVTIAPEGTAPSRTIEIDPSSGRASMLLRIRGVRTLAESETQVSDIEFDTYLPADPDPFSTRVQIEARDGGNNVLYTRTLEDVPFRPNQVTHATGRLFDPTAVTGFTFSAADWSTTDISF